MNTRLYCKVNTKPLKNNNTNIKSSLFENMNDNNSKRLYLQHNALRTREQQIKRYEGNMACCDCSGQVKGLPNNGYACTLNPRLKR
jgi:hypothetical protein